MECVAHAGKVIVCEQSQHWHFDSIDGWMDGSIKVLLFKRKRLYRDRLNENQSGSLNVQNISWNSAGT